MTGFPPPTSGRGLWGNFTRHPVWSAVIAGLIVAGILGIIHHFNTPSGNNPPGASGTPGSSPSGGSSSVATPSVSSVSPAQSIQLSKLGYLEPAVISVKGTGDLPQGEHLWVFVWAPRADRYFPQGNIDPPILNSWTVSGVHIGASALDIGHVFTIYALVVNDSTSAEIYRFAKADPNEGYSAADWQTRFRQFKVAQARVKRK
jgi:hypothetical protein